MDGCVHCDRGKLSANRNMQIVSLLLRRCTELGQSLRLTDSVEKKESHSISTPPVVKINYQPFILHNILLGDPLKIRQNHSNSQSALSRMENTCRSFPREVSDVIASFEMGVHPVASLIKDLTFEYRPESDPSGGIYLPARLAVTAPPWVSFAVSAGWWSPSSPTSRFFTLSDFGYGSPSYDRYIAESDIASGLSMGRVLES